MIKTNGNELVVNDVSVMLKPMQMKYFKLLKDNLDRVIDRELFANLHPATASDHTINQHISQLKKSLSCFADVVITSQAKVGYQMNIKGQEIKQFDWSKTDVVGEFKKHIEGMTQEEVRVLLFGNWH